MLSAIPVHTYWTMLGDQSGQKIEICRTLLKTKQPALSMQVCNHLRSSTQGSRLVNELMLKARSHWAEFEQMLDGLYYEEFWSFGPDKEAWVLVSLIGRTVFEVLNKVRGSTPIQQAISVLLPFRLLVLWMSLLALSLGTIQGSHWSSSCTYLRTGPLRKTSTSFESSITLSKGRFLTP